MSNNIIFIEPNDIFKFVSIDINGNGVWALISEKELENII
jgi:hypothetical protein